MNRARISLSIVLLACLLVLPLPARVVSAEVPSTMSYQGVLTDPGGVIVSDGSYDLVFKLYNAPTGGAELWSETQAGVSVTGGLLAVTLGSVVPLALPFDQTYWLGITVNTDAELSPRTALTSSPYALAVRTPLPPNSIDAAAIVDEPGLAESRNVGSNPVIGNPGTLARDLQVTINIPGPGYITLEGSGGITMSSTSGEQAVIYGIAETTSLTFAPQTGYYYVCGFGTVPTTAYLDLPFFCRRTYYKASAGSYTFELGTGRYGSFTPNTNTLNSVLLATYFPTSYGTVTAAAQQAPR